MYIFTKKFPRDGGVKFKCLGAKCGICCKDALINKYIKYWARKNNIDPTMHQKCCVFLDSKKYRCTIYSQRPKMCRLFPIVKIKNDFVELADNCPGVGKGRYISFNKWIKDSETHREEPDIIKTLFVYDLKFAFFAVYLFILSFMWLPLSALLLIFPIVWVYLLLKK